MKKSTIFILTCCAVLLLSFEYILIHDYVNFLCKDGSYFGQKSPGNMPMVFCPKRVSIKDHHEFGIYFSADGREFFFTRMDSNGTTKLMHARNTAYGWFTLKSLPEAESYSRKNACSPVENAKLFSEYMERKYLYQKKSGQSIYKEFPEEPDFMAPDKSYILFDLCKSDGVVNSDLYISFRKPDGGWSEAKNLGETINSEFSEWMPYVTPDGKYLFFSRTVKGETDLYWVSADAIKDLRF